MTLLHEHALTLVLPVVDGVPDRPWRPLDRGPTQAARMYLGDDARQRLYAARQVPSTTPDPIVTPRGHRWRITRAELVTLAHCEVLALVLDGGPDLTLDGLQADADVLRLQRPWWPGQTLPTSTEGGQGLRAWLARHLPGARPVLDDPRAMAWVYASIDAPPEATHPLVYALAHQDPPDMPAPPLPVLDAFFTGQGYRRWEAAGTFHAFTHHGGATVHFSDKKPAAWLRDTHTGLYVDIAVWVAAVTAARAQSCEDHGMANIPHILHDHERTWERVRISEQDQGRLLVAAWLDAIEADHGHLTFLRRWGTTDWQ